MATVTIDQANRFGDELYRCRAMVIRLAEPLKLRLCAAGIDQFEIQRRGTKLPGVKRQPLRLGLRWVVEATNTWWSNYGQLRHNTDRRARHRHAARCLATAILIVGRLIDWRNRWSPR